MPRKPVEIDQKYFELLCMEHKSKKAICRELHIGDERTIDNWCQRTYNSDFSDILEQKKELGKTRLINSALKLAEKNGAVMIFLLKNWCGYTDVSKESENNVEEIKQSFAEWFKPDDKQTDS